MKVKVRCLKNTYLVGLRWGFISKTPPLNPLKLGLRSPGCSATTATSALEGKPLPLVGHLQAANCSLQACFNFLSHLYPPAVFFFFSIDICKSVQKCFSAYLSMNSTRGQHQPLFPWSLQCILTTHSPSTGKKPSSSTPGQEQSDFLFYHVGTAYPRIGSRMGRKVSAVVSRCSSVSFP